MKRLGYIDIFGRPFAVTEHRKVKADDGSQCDGLCSSQDATIKLRRGREPHTDLHEIIHACAEAVGLPMSERNVNLLSRALWDAGVKVRYRK